MKSILQSDEACFVCGNPNTERHHVIYGTANRALSERYGLVVFLCPEHHRGDTGVHFNRAFDIVLKKYAQLVFGYVHGPSLDFVKVFGRNYL